MNAVVNMNVVRIGTEGKDLQTQGQETKGTPDTRPVSLPHGQTTVNPNPFVLQQPLIYNPKHQ